MQRIVQGLSATLSHTFYSDGTATNPSPDVATVGITREDGTVLVAPGAATTDTGTGTVTYTLTPAQTALLDTLRVTWTATFSSQSQPFTDIVEIAGGFLFSIAQARARAPLGDTTSPGVYVYPTPDLLDARTFAEQELEDACGVAFVPRYSLETVIGRGQRTLRLSHRRVRTIRSLSIDGTVMDAAYLAALRLDAGQLLWADRFMRWSWWDSRIVIGYEHGYDSPPQAASLAALDLARDRLISDTGSSTIDPRATRIITQDGEIQLTPGGTRFGVPSVDKFVAAHREPLVA